MMFHISPIFRQIACRGLSPSFLPLRSLTRREFHISAFVQKQFIDMNISSGQNNQNSVFSSSERNQTGNPEETQKDQKAARFNGAEKKVKKLTAEEKETRFFSTKFKNLKRSWKEGHITFDQYRNELGKLYDQQIASFDKYMPKVKLMNFEEFKAKNLISFEEYKEDVTKTYQLAIKKYPNSPRSEELKKYLENKNFEKDYDIYCRGLYNGYVSENSNEPNPFQKIL